MQKDFIKNAKNAMKRVAAISSGAMMLGATVLGAVAAADLSEYPSPFVKDGVYNTIVVVGDKADPADVIGSNDIVAALSQAAVRSVSASTTTTVSGGESADIPLGHPITNTSADGMDQELDYNDIAALKKSSITFASSTYDYKEKIWFDTASPIVHTALSSADYDYASDAFLEVLAGDMAYYYTFDDAINVTSADDDDTLDINFLGRDIIIQGGGDEDTIVAQVGARKYISVDGTEEVAGKVVKLHDVGSSSVVVSVDDGESYIINEGSSRTISGIDIHVDSVFDSDVKADKAAVLIIGEDAVVTYDDGDAYVVPCATKWYQSDCDEDDADWEWDLRNLDDDDSTDLSDFSGPIIGIVNTYNADSYNDGPVGVGEAYDFPEGNLEVQFVELAPSTYEAYTIEYDSGSDLSEAGFGSTEETIYIHTAVDEGIEVMNDNLDGDAMGGDVKTDKVWIWIDDGAATKDTFHVFYEDADNDVAYAGNSTSMGDDETLFRINYDDTKGNDITIATEGTSFSGGANTWGLEITATDDYVSEAIILVTNHGTANTTSFGGFGANENNAEAADLTWDAVEIGAKDEDLLTKYGIIIENPESLDDDKLVLQIPSDSVKAKIVVAGESTSVTSGTAGDGAVEVQSIATLPIAKLASEADAIKTTKPLILVGGPAANALTAEAMGKTFPSYGADSGIPENSYMIKLVENAFGGTNVAMIAAGWDAADTREACALLKNYKANSDKLTGMEYIPA